MTRANRARGFFITTIIVLSVAIIAGGGWVVFDQNQRIQQLVSRVDDQNDAVSSLTDDLVASQQNAQALYDQLLSLGEDPDGSDPDTVITGPAGAAGPRGEAGRSPTGAEIAAAVAAYCAVNNQCAGPAGPAGPVGPLGAAGADGAAGVDGADGRAGDTGETGATGAAGADGQSAFPFTLTIPIDDVTYACVVSSPTVSSCTPTDPSPQEGTS